ncbi:MAG TPA: DNA sulfur modification protein DndB [Myxococcaceae bacterium]|jgi:DNA sulfur modification protein DndB
MSIVVPCIRGVLGNTEFYETTLKASRLVDAARPAKELDEWATMGIEERMQREPNLKRIRDDIAPYLAKSSDRFFGALIVLVYEGNLEFEPLNKVGIQVPAAYKKEAEKVGFVSFDDATLVVLDGQHRLLALEEVVKLRCTGPEASKVPNDDICVILIKHENNQKTRRIFNKVNRYAKPTSRGDNIITSEDDAYAIISRWLLDRGPLDVTYPVKEGVKESIVDWKSNTLSGRSSKISTISAVYETVKIILSAAGVPPIDAKQRPPDEDLEKYFEMAHEFWDIVLKEVDVYKAALNNPSLTAGYRDDEERTSLLFKPASQIAVIQALTIVKKRGLSLKEAAKRLTLIDWSMHNPAWKNVIIKPNGSIDVSTNARYLAANLFAYLLAPELIDAADKAALLNEYNIAHGVDPATAKKSELLALPEPPPPQPQKHKAVATPKKKK